MFLSFDDGELEALIDNINTLQIFYHHKYADDGRITFHSMMELQGKDTFIFIDNNILSPICECIKTGTVKDKLRLRKIATLITFSKFINAQMNCGLCLVENDTAQKATTTAEEQRQLFLYAVDKIPALVWKSLALGYCDSIPDAFLKNYKFINTNESYRFDENLHYLMHQAAMTKLVILLRDTNKTGFEKFIIFINWLADNLLITESVFSYAALLFGDVKNIKRPKKYSSNEFEKVLDGIKNQAWDIFYVSKWSTFYYKNTESDVYALATDDNTLKMIVANSIPDGQSRVLIDYLFSTPSQQKIIDDFYEEKLGINRKKPFEKNEYEKGLKIVKTVLCQQLTELQNIISGSVNT